MTGSSPSGGTEVEAGEGRGGRARSEVSEVPRTEPELRAKTERMDTRHL